jgi:hypothetical protein
MKKLLTATLVLLVLAAFPGLSAAQEKKKAPDKPKETMLPNPPPDRLTLSKADPGAAPHGNVCPVIARPWYSGNNAYKYPDRLVVFVKVSKPFIPGEPPPSGTTNTNGVLWRTVDGGLTIHAVLGTGPSALVSNNFTCTLPPPPPPANEKKKK